MRDAVDDGLGDDGLGERRQTAIAPQLVAAREVGPQRRALGIRSVAPCARHATHVAVEDPVAERDLRGRGPEGGGNEYPSWAPSPLTGEVGIGGTG